MPRQVGWLLRKGIFRLSHRQNWAQIGETSSTFLDKLSQVYTDLNSILSFHSTVYENYLNAASIQDTRRNFRISLLLFLFTVWTTLPSASAIANHEKPGTAQILLVALLVVSILYLYTFNQYNHLWYTRYSCILLTTAFVYAINKIADITSRWVAIVPYLKLLICLFILLPVKLDLTLTMIVLFSLAFSVLTGFQQQFGMCAETAFGNKSVLRSRSIEPTGHRLCDADEMALHNNLGFITCLVVIVGGFHLQFWNTIRRRAAFIYLGQAVHLEKRNKKAELAQENLQGVLMPPNIWNAYCGRENSRQAFGRRFLYQQPGAKITILVAEIVNFPELTLQNDLQKLVTILSDVLDYFDKRAEIHGCERLRVDAEKAFYTCGVTRPKMNHARACVDLGLDMTRVNEHLTIEGNTLILLKIGVHSGSATIMVWGCRRIHYDLLSIDITIASRLKDACPPGFVTISESTHAKVHTHFLVEPAQRVTIELQRMVNGQLFVDYKHVQTYYVHQDITTMSERSSSSSLRSELGTIGRCIRVINLIRLGRTRRSTLINQDFSNRTLPKLSASGRRSIFSLSAKSGESRQQNMDIPTSAWNTDKSQMTEADKLFILDAEVLRLVTELRADPKRHITLMQYLPIGRWTNVFLNKELEWHYLNHVHDPTYPIYVDSLKLAPALDAFANLTIISIMVMCSHHFTKRLPQSNLFKIIHASEILGSAILVCCVVWTSTRFVESIRYVALRRVFLLLRRNVTRKLILFVLLIVPPLHSIAYTMIIEDSMDTSKNYYTAVICFQLIAVVNYMAVTTNPHWMGLFGVLINATVYMSIHERFSQRHKQNVGDKPDHILLASESFVNDVVTETWISVFMLWTMLNLNDRNCRLNFLCMRELQICREQAELLQDKLNDTLRQLLPQYVVDRLLSDTPKSATVNLDVCNATLNNVGIAVLYLSNLYTTHWFSGSEEWQFSLKVVNVAVCMIDDLLWSRRYKGLERIRIANDKIVVISKNEPGRPWDTTENSHLERLLDFCLEVQKKLHGINEEYLLSSTPLSLKIGCTRGSLNTGIIGLIKPAYINWGKSVQLATTLARNGYPGEVMASKSYAKSLSVRYEVIFANVISADESGLLETFIIRSMH